MKIDFIMIRVSSLLLFEPVTEEAQAFMSDTEYLVFGGFLLEESHNEHKIIQFLADEGLTVQVPR